MKQIHFKGESMKHLTATVVSFLSAFMLYMATAMTFTQKGQSVPSIAFVAFFGGWVLTHYFCVKNTQSNLKVLNRGFLIGGLEWIMMIFAGIVMSSKAIVETTAGSTSAAHNAGAAIGGGMAAMFTGAFSGVMAAICFFAFMITYFLSKELKEDKLENSKDCPDCAEPVNVNAKKCKHCGCVFAGSLSEVEKEVA